MKYAIRLLLLLMGIAAGWEGCHLLEVAIRETDPRAELPPCFEIGSPFHHRFRPFCAGLETSPRGPIKFSTNGEGVRDFSRALLLEHPHRILVMGDSFVEGWWASAEQTLTAALSARFSGIFFINGGLRSTGPLMQARRLEELQTAYRPEAILWFLNDTDGPDDRLACALTRNPKADPLRWDFAITDFELSGWREKFAGFWPDSGLARRIRRHAYEEKWKLLVNSSDAGRCGSCLGVQTFAKVASVPVLPIFISGHPTAHYEGSPSSQEEILSCLKQAGLSPGLVGPFNPERDYWENDFHLNPEGNLALVDKISPLLERWFLLLRKKDRIEKP